MSRATRTLDWLPGRTRRVEGATDDVVIVGAGLAGLSTAMRLAGAGRNVTVLEREDVPGGRAGLSVKDVPDGQYRFDTGPSVLTMPDLIADCFDSLGEDMHDWLDLKPVDPLYRGTFADGSSLQVSADVERTAQAIEELCGAAEADGYRRFVAHVGNLYRYEIRDFIDSNIDTPLDLLKPNLVRLLAAGGFKKMAPEVAKYLKDPRTQRMFSFQALYAGVSPFDALALYSVIAYMDTVAGVFFPKGGMHAIPTAMAAAAEKHGVTFHYGTEVARVERTGRRATGVITTDGRRFAADVVVLNPDLPVAHRDLLGTDPWRVRHLTYSPSCFLMHVGSSADYPDPVHHSIHFGAAWEQVFDELVDGRLMSDPSILVSRPTVSDPGLAPAGKHVYYVLFPTPSLAAGSSPVDWDRLAPRYREHVMEVLTERGYPGFDGAVEVEDVITPADWERQGMEAGAPFASSHLFRQTGPFRPGNLWGDNVVFAGSGTQPGVGVPMVLVSGRLAAERITGRDRSYRSRAWR
ncbi:phytoene desaturase family protein [Kineococcus rubinsiae]|uniref:phytoene desaturase family protein n=1 Tax=Kineococcus rubinsiae TaxID=2609562 RepID=UPI00142F57CB|nr:phytoene desaturase family protein [Kineococcus rubinsiae]NIZ92917.1 phytoene desaturase [Kineococcus rubinsiae]